MLPRNVFYPGLEQVPRVSAAQNVLCPGLTSSGCNMKPTSILRADVEKADLKLSSVAQAFGNQQRPMDLPPG